MTNGEKLKELFPHTHVVIDKSGGYVMFDIHDEQGICQVSSTIRLDWWNSEYNADNNEVIDMEDKAKACAKDILEQVERVHYSPEFSDFRIRKGCRGEIEYIINFIQQKYLSEVD